MSEENSNDSGEIASILRFDGVLGRIEDSFNLIAATSILVLMLLAVVQVLGRTLFNFPIPGFIDITEQAMAVFAFLGIAFCQRVGGHIRMGLALGKLRRRNLWLVEFLGVSLIWIVISILIVGSWLHFLRAWELGDSTIDIGLPVWPSKLIIPVAFSLLWLRLILQMYGYLRLIVNPEASPIVVPENLDTTETAQHEIDTALANEPVERNQI